MPNGGLLSVRASVKTNPEILEDFVEIVIRDSGPGIDQGDLARLSDPFFTTKEGGTGLGLAIAYTIVQKHNGRITVESEIGRGAAFLLSLPIAKEDSWRRSPSSTSDLSLCHFLKRALILKGYDVFTFHGGREALEGVKEDCDLVLLDNRMPDLSGLEVLQEMKQRFPKMPVII
jgi:hypothetical protein